MARQAKNQPTQSYSLPASYQSGSSKPGISAHIMGPRILILLVTLALLLIGFVMVYSASSIVALWEGESTESYLIKQLAFAAIGIVGCLILWKLIPYQVWAGPFVWVVWAVAVALLILTAVMGMAEYGAQRWLSLGFIGIQPSEFAKIAFLLMSARILIDFRSGNLGLRGMIVQAFVLILIPLMFLYRSQSDLGTTLICFIGILAIMWLGEVPLRVILGIVGLGILFVIIASTVGYRQDRFVFLNPWNDGAGGLGTGYQLIHSFYAFSEGGIFGVGLGNSREKYLYLPMSETDFIFAIIGEELGLIGAFGVVILFVLFLYAGMRIARSAPDSFGTLLAGGLTIMLVFQAFLNIGCVIGLLPTTGKPLPFISSGGSSLIASLLMFGIILSVSQGSNRPSVYEQRRDDLRVVRAQPPASYQSASSSRRGGNTGSMGRSGNTGRVGNSSRSGNTGSMGRAGGSSATSQRNRKNGSSRAQGSSSGRSKSQSGKRR